MSEECENVDRLQVYLEELLDEKGGTIYAKSKFLAQDVDHSPQQVGACLFLLSEESETLSVEKWGGSTATTWKITEA